MTALQDLLRRIAGDLDVLGYGWALVGGLAVSVRSVPRFTADVDLVVAVTDDTQTVALARSLRDRGWLIDTLIEQDRMKRLATVRLRGEEDTTPVVDLLFASSGVELEIVAGADTIDVFPGHPVHVASVGHLIALKLLARDDTRPLDDADLTALLDVAEPRDLHTARDAIGLITMRGFSRGRDLQEALANLLNNGT